ncbi:MAG: PqqD family protein [Ignavibacteria bacterium]
MAFFKKKLNFNLLELTPVINKNFVVTDEGLVMIVFPKFRNRFLKKLIPKNKPQDFKISLDRLGSAVWFEIDGKKKVAEIVEKLEKQIGEEISPAAERISKFLTQLYSYKFIRFVELKK